MLGTPKVSIIIACYNDYNVTKAVKSALAQTYGVKEIILVNDGSNNQVSQLIEGLGKKVDLIVTQANQGQSIARNNAIKKSTGEYILNLDSDDFFEPTFCEKAVSILEEDKQVKIVTCKARRFNEKGEIDVFTPMGGEIKSFLYSNAALGSAMFRKEDWKSCGGYEEKLPILGIEDWEFYLNILKNGGYAYVIPEVLFSYRVRPNSITAKIKNYKLDMFKHIIFKHADLYEYNFKGLVTNLIDRAKLEELEKIKNTERIEYKIGLTLLKPLRYFRSLI